MKEKKSEGMKKERMGKEEHMSKKHEGMKKEKKGDCFGKK